MGKAFKNIAFFLATVLLTAAIYWIVFVDNASKGDVLESSLNMLGEKLMAMVPDNTEKDSVKKMYDDFVVQAKANDVAPEQVEQVAANIFNLSNLDTTLTPVQAEAVLKYSLETPVRVARDRGANSTGVAQTEKKSTPVVISTSRKKYDRKEWEALGNRIVEFNNLNEEIHRAIREKARDAREQSMRMHFRINNGLRIAIDPRIMEDFDKEEFERLAKQMRHMEKKELIEWRKDFRKEMMEMRHELKELQELRHLEGMQSLRQLESLQALKSLEALKALEGLEFVPPVINADSIQAIVIKSLKEAGIDTEEKNK